MDSMRIRLYIVMVLAVVLTFLSLLLLSPSEAEPTPAAEVVELVQEARPWNADEPIKHYRVAVLQDTMGVTIRVESHFIIDTCLDPDGAAILIYGGIEGEPAPRTTQGVFGYFSIDVDEATSDFLVCVIAVEDLNWPDFLAARQYCTVWNPDDDSLTLPSGVTMERDRTVYHGCAVEPSGPDRRVTLW